MVGCRRRLRCSHAFHPKCIGRWLVSHNTCPVCRTRLGAPLSVRETIELEALLLRLVLGIIVEKNVSSVPQTSQVGRDAFA